MSGVPLVDTVQERRSQPAAGRVLDAMEASPLGSFARSPVSLLSSREHRRTRRAPRKEA